MRRMKWWVLTALCVCLASALMAGGVHAEEIENRSDVSVQWKYAVTEHSATITGFQGALSGGIIIPGELDGYTVTGIGDQAFRGNDDLNFVAIPQGVTYIGDNAFEACGALASVIFPDSLAVIGSRAFADCGSLLHATLPETMDAIGDYAFAGCVGMVSVTLPDGEVSIGEDIFAGCGGLTILAQTGSVAADYAVEHRTTDIMYTTDYPGIQSRISGTRGYVNIAAKREDASGLWTYYVWSSGDVTLIAFKQTPNGDLMIPSVMDGWYAVTEIGKELFSRCDGLTSVTIPNGVTRIRDSAFWYCSSLFSVTIPDSLTRIGSSAFARCGITNVVIPDSVTEIERGAFERCYDLTSVSISDSLTVIEKEVFYGCAGLTSVVIPGSVQTIGENAFAACEGLTNVTIPAGVTEIHASAFDGCPKLILTVEEGSAAEQYAKANDILYRYSDGNMWLHPGQSAAALRRIIAAIRGNAAEPVEEALNWKYDLTENGAVITGYERKPYGVLVLPEEVDGHAVTAIGDRAFWQNEDITSVIIPEGVTSIGSAFGSCGGITSVALPSTLTRIGDQAFWNCRALSGISIPDNVTAIGDGAFSMCTGIAEITIPVGVTSIGASAFFYCKGLTSVTIPGSVKSIGASAFDRCVGLTSVTILDGVKSIGDEAFLWCGNLASLTIPASVKSIGKNSFGGCKNLTLTVVKGSAAERYASVHFIPYVAIEDTSRPDDDVFSGCFAMLCDFIRWVVTMVGNIFN